MLLAKSDVALAKLLRQSVLINFFQNPQPKVLLTANAQPMIFSVNSSSSNLR